MARPRKEIDQKQFENLCGLQCTLEEICGWFDVTDKTLDSWCKRTYHASFSEVFKQKRGAGENFAASEPVAACGKERKHGDLAGGNSTLGSAILWSWVCRLTTRRMTH